MGERISPSGVSQEKILLRRKRVEKQFIFSPEGNVRCWETKSIDFFLESEKGEKTRLKFLGRESFGHPILCAVPLPDRKWMILKITRRKDDPRIDRTRNFQIFVSKGEQLLYEQHLTGCYIKDTSTHPHTKEQYVTTPNWQPLRPNIKKYELNYCLNSNKTAVIFRAHDGDFKLDIDSGSLLLIQP